MDPLILKLAASKADYVSKSSSFKTRLPQALDFSKDIYSVGLVDISLECNMYNLQDDQFIEYYIYDSTNPKFYRIGKYDFNKIPKGYYKDMYELAGVINERLEWIQQWTASRFGHTIIVDEKKGCARIDHHFEEEYVYCVVLPDKVAEMLGIPNNRYKSVIETFLSKYHEDKLILKDGNKMRSMLYSPLENLPYRRNQMKPVKFIHVLTNIVKSISFGNSTLSTIGTIPIKHYKFGDILHYQFSDICWIPVSESSIQSIQIDLVDETFKHLNNPDAEVILTLAFKKVSIKHQDAEPSVTPIVEVEESAPTTVVTVTDKQSIDSLFKNT